MCLDVSVCYVSATLKIPARPFKNALLKQRTLFMMPAHLKEIGGWGGS